MRDQIGNNVTGGTQRNHGWRDKAIPTRAIACPDCKQPIGAACVNAAGTATSNHTARRRVALRSMREAMCD